MTQELFTAFVGGGGNKQLVARGEADVKTYPVLLNHLINAAVVRGCIVFAAGPAGPFSKATHVAMPAETDIVALVADPIDLTGAAVDVASVGFIGGEFIKESVFAASDATLDATDKLTLEELMLKRGMYLVHTAYGANTESLV